MLCTEAAKEKTSSITKENGTHGWLHLEVEKGIIKKRSYRVRKKWNSWGFGDGKPAGTRRI